MTVGRWCATLLAGLLLWLATTVGSPVAAQQQAATATVAAPGGAMGIAAKKPVLGAACAACPWGAMATIVNKAMAPYGWDVQVCNNCMLPEAPRIVSAAKRPPPWKPSTSAEYPAYLTPPPPDAPVDFGTAASLRVWQAYAGTFDYAKEPPHRNLRLIANIQNPNFLVVAVKADSGITDLAQLKARKQPLRLLTQNSPEANGVLAYYGLTRENIVAAGGAVTQDRGQPFDVIIYNAGMGNAPEYNVWRTVSEKYDLRFLTLPDDLLGKLARDNEIDRGTLPLWMFRGVDREIPTVVQTGNAIYCRDDAPDSFAYAVAKALDEQQDLLQWSHLAFYYDSRKVWQDRGLPLHPGAARYYRERGYMK